MKGTELVINFENNQAYLTDKIYLPFEQIEVSDFFDKANYVGSWLVKVLQYNPIDSRIFVEVLFYNSYKQPFPAHQLVHAYELTQVQTIGFRSIDTTAVFKTVKASKTKGTFSPSIIDRPIRDTPTANYEVLPKAIKESVSLPLDSVYFRSGYVSFEKKIANLINPVEFRVYNPHIREEFDSVKNYFGNVLRAKKFRFDITGSIINQEISDIQAISADIDRIDDKFIEDVKLEIVKRITDTKFEDESEKTLLTMDDLFDALTENKVKADIFFEDEKSFLNEILNTSDTKHYKQLRFLSDKHSFSIMKLRFILKPFSFIFLIQGESKFNIVWETLNTTEATYLWQEDSDVSALKTQLEKIDGFIKSIKISGRMDYLSKEHKNFKRIYHDYSDLVTGFNKWKNEIEEAIV